MRRERDAGRCAAWLSWPAAPAALPHGSNCWSINEFSANWTYHGGRLNIIRHNLSPLNESWLFYSTNKRGPFMRCNSMRNFFFPMRQRKRETTTTTAATTTTTTTHKKKTWKKSNKKWARVDPEAFLFSFVPQNPTAPPSPPPPPPNFQQTTLINSLTDLTET